MALIKSEEEIIKLREGGALLSFALQSAVNAVKVGVTMNELNSIAESVIIKGGGKPSFKGYTGGGDTPFPSTVCISVNDEVVHGVGSREIVLKDGDIVGLDIGLWLHGLCTDMAVSVPVGNVNKEKTVLLRDTRNSMYAGIEKAVIGGLISDIGEAVEKSLNTKKYGIVRSLVGHGVGHEVHELPHIPNFKTKHFPKVNIQKGMVLAIEPMVTLGSHEIKTASDGWTISTVDRSDSAHFEVTIAVGEDGPEIITPQPEIEI